MFLPSTPLLFERFNLLKFLLWAPADLVLLENLQKEFAAYLTLIFSPLISALSNTFIPFSHSSWVLNSISAIPELWPNLSYFIPHLVNLPYCSKSSARSGFYISLFKFSTLILLRLSPFGFVSLYFLRRRDRLLLLFNKGLNLLFLSSFNLFF